MKLADGGFDGPDLFGDAVKLIEANMKFFDPLSEAASRFSREQAAPHMIKQGESQGRLQIADQAAGSGLRNSHYLGRAGDRAGDYDKAERLHLTKLHVAGRCCHVNGVRLLVH